LLAALVAAGVAFARAAFAEGAMDKPGMTKPMTDKMGKPGTMRTTSDADKMKKPAGMMDDKKDTMSAPMKKN
jgi:pentapeptide MXKDX repeat protein